MNAQRIPGTIGYDDAVQSFIDATLALSFKELHADFLPFFPSVTGRVLDIGAGIGRDASVFAQAGHSVAAIEPLEAFREAGKRLYASTAIEWIADALPELTLLDQATAPFDLILVSGVWHHLNAAEQHRAMQRIAGLLSPKGVLALTLRNGPAGAGTHVFPTDGKQTVEIAEAFGLTTLLLLENQPSLMKNKEQVSWTKLVFQQTSSSSEINTFEM